LLTESCHLNKIKFRVPDVINKRDGKKNHVIQGQMALSAMYLNKQAEKTLQVSQNDEVLHDCVIRRLQLQEIKVLMIN